MQPQEYEFLIGRKDQYSQRTLKAILDGDLEGSIISTWRLLYIESKDFLNLIDNREGYFNVHIVDELGHRFEEIDTRQLHKLRMARNVFDKGNEVTDTPTWDLVTSGLKIVAMIIEQKTEEISELSHEEIQTSIISGVCPNCKKDWEGYDECEWCGFTLGVDFD